jgi:hypothetical protein
MAISHRWELFGEEQQIILLDEAPFLVSPSIHSHLAKRDLFEVFSCGTTPFASIKIDTEANATET